MVGSGDRLGPYVLGAELGEGGMGKVFRARRGAEEVAVKVMKDELAADPDQARRFLREAQSLRDVQHPNVVRVDEVGVDGERPFIAMELLDGASLDTLVSEGNGLPLPAVERMVLDAGRGLDAIHAAGLIHRDVKPGNLVVGPDGRATVMDLGLVKRRNASALTALGTVVGTITYLAPELIRGQPATRASDVYALGCVAFEAIVGRPPYVGNMFEIGLGHLEHDPPLVHELRDGVPPGASDAIRFALAKEPEKRPATGAALATMLRMGLAG